MSEHDPSANDVNGSNDDTLANSVGTSSRMGTGVRRPNVPSLAVGVLATVSLVAACVFHWLRSEAGKETLQRAANGMDTSSVNERRTAIGQGADARSTSANQTSTASQTPVAAEVTPPLLAIPPQASPDVLHEGRLVADHLVEFMPQSLEAKEMQARFEYEFGDTTRARQIWQSVIDVNPHYVYALVGLGDVATIEGQLQAAVRYYRQAVLADPNNLSRQVTLGIALLHAAQLDDAKQVLSGVLARDPKNVQAHVELASVLAQLQELEAAREHFEIALQSKPELAEIHFGLINVYRRLGNREKAAHHQAEHARLQKDVVAKRERGRREYNDDRAIQFDVGKLYVDMARVYLAGGFRKSAELLLLRASRMEPENVDARQALAAAAVGQGKPFDAIRWLSEISELRPDDVTFVREMARLYCQINRPDDAEKLLTSFVAERPQHLVARRALAMFFLEVRSQPERAVEHAQAAIDLSPTASSFAMLASMHEAAGNLQQAIESLKKAVELEPRNSSYQQALALLREGSDAKPVQNGGAQQ